MKINMPLTTGWWAAVMLMMSTGFLPGSITTRIIGFLYEREVWALNRDERSVAQCESLLGTWLIWESQSYNSSWSWLLCFSVDLLKSSKMMQTSNPLKGSDSWGLQENTVLCFRSAELRSHRHFWNMLAGGVAHISRFTRAQRFNRQSAMLACDHCQQHYRPFSPRPSRFSMNRWVGG